MDDDNDLIMQLFAIEELEQRELDGEVTRRTYEPIDPFECKYTDLIFYVTIKTVIILLK